MSEFSSGSEREPHTDSFEARETAERPRCGHCGQPFDPRLSSAGDHGICRECFDA